MKNIHVLQTDNYSPLVNSTSKYGGLFLSKYYSPMKSMGDSYQNIYITSDEKFVRDEYVTDGIEVIKATPKLVNAQGLVSRRNWRKIILTTDQDLIKDGVQAIPDEFLEWFVKNPSCEFVEVNMGYLGIGGFVKSNEPISEDKIEEYLGVWSSEAKSKLTELCEGVFSKVDEIALYKKFLDEFTDKDGLMKPCNPDAIFNWFGWKLWRSKQ